MDSHHTIKALGGAHAVGRELRKRGVSVADVTVRSWTLADRKIPAKYWTHIAAIAGDAGQNLSFEALARDAAATAEQAAA